MPPGESDEQIRGAMQRLTGKAYRALDLSKLDDASRHEIARFVRDAEEEIAHVKRQVRNQPWRFMR